MKVKKFIKKVKKTDELMINGFVSYHFSLSKDKRYLLNITYGNQDEIELFIPKKEIKSGKWNKKRKRFDFKYKDTPFKLEFLKKF